MEADSSSIAALVADWTAIQADAPPKPREKPSPEQLASLRAHKARARAFLDSLTAEQRAAVVAADRKSSKPAKAKRVAANRARQKDQRANNGACGRSAGDGRPAMAPKPGPVRLGWDGSCRAFDRVVWFYSHRNRSRVQELEDESVLGGIDRRIFSNLFEQKEGLRVPPLLDSSGKNWMRWDFLGDAVGRCSESFFQAAKCMHEFDARFVMSELSSLQAAEFGQSRMGLTDGQRERLVGMGADPDDFMRVESGATNDGSPVSPAWLRGRDGRLPRRGDWEDAKLYVMLHIVRHKFGPAARGVPARTAAALLRLPSVPLLVEHTMNDSTWADGNSGEGSNLLGKSLTQALLELSGTVDTAPLGMPTAALRGPNSDLVSYCRPKIVRPAGAQRAKDPRVDYLCVLDFEATCDDGPAPRPQEIIEFPTLLVNTRTGRVEREFHVYVKPDVHPMLSTFCSDLTGIMQDVVDAGVPLEEALSRHRVWLSESNLVLHQPDTKKDSGKSTFLFLTCGDWDLQTCLPRQFRYHNKNVPPAFARWINVKVAFHNLYRIKPTGMTSMLRLLGMQLEGRHHSGIHDCRNIARICTIMLEDGWDPKQTNT